MKRKLFTVGKTYSVVTPKSARNGDVAESGWDFKPKRMSLRDLLDEVNELGSFENLQENFTDSQSIYSVDSEVDMYSGSETTYALHIDGPKRAMKRLVKILKQ